MGSKNDYWDILSITANLFYFYLFRTDNKINYNKFRDWFLNNPLYIKSSESDETIIDFLHIHENRRDYVYIEYLNKMTYENLQNLVPEINNNEININL